MMQVENGNVLERLNGVEESITKPEEEWATKNDTNLIATSEINIVDKLIDMLNDKEETVKNLHYELYKERKIREDLETAIRIRNEKFMIENKKSLDKLQTEISNLKKEINQLRKAKERKLVIPDSFLERIVNEMDEE